INSEDNPADAFTKASPNHALERFVNSNKLRARCRGRYSLPSAFNIEKEKTSSVG
ncbi:hypothetical protein BU23DRAFT_384077, partial [Bimuria novae-zelandiae CBS 107.79]